MWQLNRFKKLFENDLPKGGAPNHLWLGDFFVIKVLEAEMPMTAMNNIPGFIDHQQRNSIRKFASSVRNSINVGKQLGEAIEHNNICNGKTSPVSHRTLMIIMFMTLITTCPAGLKMSTAEGEPAKLPLMILMFILKRGAKQLLKSYHWPSAVWRSLRHGRGLSYLYT